MNTPIYTSEVKAELIDALASDMDVARAAWVSNFGDNSRVRESEDISKLISFLYNNKHMSPFEHGIFKFYIDCPIFVAREFMRHRTFSFNEVSGRYRELDGKFYVPDASRPLIQKGKVGAYTFEPGSDEQYVLKRQSDMRAFESAWTEYQYQLELGIAKETARNVLPVGIYTSFYASVDPRNLMQFLTLRNDKHALYEIRLIAEQMEKALEEKMPLTYKAYTTAREKERTPLVVVDDLKSGGQIFKDDGKQILMNNPYKSVSDVSVKQGDKIARSTYPENYKAPVGTTTEPDWAIDSYVPRHRADVSVVLDDMSTNAAIIARQVKNLMERTDEYGRRKLEK